MINHHQILKTQSAPQGNITFKSDNGRELLLKGVDYNVFIDGLMSTTAIEQKYSNPFDTNIEAIYTFPLSAESILLNIEVNINGRLLKGTIVESSKAEHQYEEAIEEGNRAVMVERDSNGIYTVNIGNILPYDDVTIIIEYSELLQWKQNQVKLSIPTTIAQKYGDANDLGLDDVKEPNISLMAENRFTFNMFIQGILLDADISAPSHHINMENTPLQTHVRLSNKDDVMDRDITLTFKSEKDRAERSFALVGKDIDGYASIASFFPSLDNEYEKKPKSITFVIDCSASMSGVSINKARQALFKAVELLDEKDFVNMVKFGSYSEKTFNKEVPATKENLEILNDAISQLQADMGGTEMAEALRSAYESKKSDLEINRYLFLITDGEIYEHERVINNAISSEISHFVIGVGYATDDSLLNALAVKTQGAFENIDPNEKMDEYILTMFKRIDMPKTTDIKLEYSTKVLFNHTPKIIFDGDTLYCYATSKEKPLGNVNLYYTLENGEDIAMSTSYMSQSDTAERTVARIVANERIKAESDTEKIASLSLDYQLLSPYTNYILVDEVDEDEKIDAMPEIYRVKSMLARGMMESAPNYSKVRRPSSVTSAHSMHEDFLDVPHFIRTQPDYDEIDNEEEIFDKHEIKSPEIDTSIETMVNALPSYYVERAFLMIQDWFVDNGEEKLPNSIDQLQILGIHRNDVIETLENSSSESDAVESFIYLLSNRYTKMSGESKVLDSFMKAYLESLE